MGVKASNYFMPSETLSDKGPGGGGWIYINKKLQVTDKNGKLFGNGCIWAVGDCNFGEYAYACLFVFGGVVVWVCKGKEPLL